jgi:hypothetical protein
MSSPCVSKKMIYDDSTIEVRTVGDEQTIRERDNWMALLRLIGVIPMLAGCAVFSATMNLRPVGGSVNVGYVFGVLLVGGVGMALFWMGFSFLFLRGGFVIDVSQNRIQSRVFLLGWPVWTRDFAVSKFDRICVAHRRRGKSWHFFVSLVGANAELVLVAVKTHEAADAFVKSINGELRFPNEFHCSQCQANAA